MSYLTDANPLLRYVDVSSVQNTVAASSLNSLMVRGEQVFLVPQTVYEFWSVATRPQEARGGLGFDRLTTQAAINDILKIFPLRRDPPDIYDIWYNLVLKYDVKGVNVHDARLVAAMIGLNITHLLTFNTKDFARYTEITVVHPQDIQAFVG